MKFMLGIKGQMTQMWGDDGVVHAATIISAGPLTVTALREKARDGYESAQVGFDTLKESKVKKPQAGKPFRFFREAPLVGVTEGQIIDASVFSPGDVVAVSAISKGKGFQGVVKRHGFKGGPRSHGQKNKERAPGSIGGAGRAGGRVAKGMRMAGRMGGDRVTVKNLKVLAIEENGTMLISGAVPGPKGALVEIRG
jgi:large subunit ribosomal protein L3